MLLGIASGQEHDIKSIKNDVGTIKEDVGDIKREIASLEVKFEQVLQMLATLVPKTEK